MQWKMTDVLDWQKNKYLGSAPEKITYLSKANKSKRSVGKHKNVCFSTSLSTPFWYFAVCALKYTLLDKRWQNSPKQSRAVYTLLWWGYSVNPSPPPRKIPQLSKFTPQILLFLSYLRRKGVTGLYLVRSLPYFVSTIGSLKMASRVSFEKW